MKNPTKLLAPFAAMIVFSATVNAASFREHPDDREPSTARRPYAAGRAEQQLSRVRAVMLPLLRVTNHRISAEEIEVSIVDDPAINAATAGAGRYFVTTGLLKRATDDQLRGVLAHEIAHEDLGHPAKAQVIGTGLSIGAALLEQLIPGSGALAPIAGTLISNNYTRPLELASRSPCGGAARARGLFQAHDGRHSRLADAPQRRQRRRRPVEPSGNLRAHSSPTVAPLGLFKLLPSLANSDGPSSSIKLSQRADCHRVISPTRGHFYPREKSVGRT